MEESELKDDELVDVTGGSAEAESMYKHKYYAMLQNCDCMDNLKKVYKQILNMYQEECMGNDLTPKERNGILRMIQMSFRKRQRELEFERASVN